MLDKKQTNAEDVERARVQRMNTMADKLRTQLIEIGHQKQTLIDKVVEARKKGLSTQEAQARELLGECMMAEKNTNAMLMTLELTEKSRDLAELHKKFLEAISPLTEDSEDKGIAKQAKKQHKVAIAKVEERTKKLDKMLEAREYAVRLSESGDKYAEFDEEIDVLIQQAEMRQKR